MATIHTSIDRFIHLSAATLAFAALAAAGFAQNSGRGLPPSAAKVSIMIMDAESSAPVLSNAVAETNTESARWADIKDYTIEMRGAFFAGFERLETTVNRQINELTARRAALKNSVEIKELDLAIQNMDKARFLLAFMGDLLGKSTPQTWDKQKTKVGLAWAKTQETYARANIARASN